MTHTLFLVIVLPNNLVSYFYSLTFTCPQALPRLFPLLGQLWKDLEATKEEVTGVGAPSSPKGHLGQSSASLLRQHQDNLSNPYSLP